MELIIRILFLYLFSSLLFLMPVINAQMPGFVSIDCGGKQNFTDELGLIWTPDDQLMFGQTTNVSVAKETRQQYLSLRYFPADNRKYCYTLNVTSRGRYLIRATFLYGNFDNNNVYPKFDISLGATHWATIDIWDANRVEVNEMIFLALDPTISVCLSNATTGQPFISTLELRQLNGSVYATHYESRFHLGVSARINFGADSEYPVRYPDDPFDRIWQSDLIKKANYLVDVAAGTERISTRKPIDVSRNEMPPQKVMQTAVVGRNGTLTYRLNLDGFPGFSWAFTYLAEIEDLGPKDARKFRLVLPGNPDISKATVNIQENARGKYRLYEPGYYNLTLPFVLSFEFGRTSDSTQGPLLNAMEINKLIERSDGSLDRKVIISITSLYSYAMWAQETGDPCLPVPWAWVECNSDPQPRITKIKLSGMNLTGGIPSDLAKLNGLVELWLDGNLLTGPIPDLFGCTELKIIHLENNKLTGDVPSSLAALPNLKELYLQNNSLSGTLPSKLLDKGLLFEVSIFFPLENKIDLSSYNGNENLQGKNKRGFSKVIIGSLVGVTVLLVATVVSCILLHKRGKANPKKGQCEHSVSSQKSVSYSDVSKDAAHCFTLSEIKHATKEFEQRVGSGGFGVVYYGRMKDGREIAVKLLTSNSYQGKREFSNEVALLSRIHHRNLVQFLGYCQEEEKSILVYEFMHNGTLKEHLYRPQAGGQTISWIKRLEIAEDTAKGIEYLHTGCVPSIIHRDLKTSNILLDKNMHAKVSDFGLSKLSQDGASHVSSIVRGTVGYLDPEYYISQQLTEKSDVYSFGVILLELISGQEAISNESFGVNCRNIVQWAKLHIENGDIQGVIDVSLNENYDIQTMWKIAEKALMCVQPHGYMRPSMSEVLKEIHECIVIERGPEAVREGNTDDIPRHLRHSSMNMGSFDLSVTDHHSTVDESTVKPYAR